MQVVAHEIEDGPKQVVPCMKLRGIAAGGVERDFCRGQGEYQPTLTGIDRGEFQNVAKECPICCRIFAVQEDMSADDHEASVSA